ncbi:hypothetical protein [Streptomyces sp. NPDC060194]|uniref:hypothetical protein n=1 Tax=Streptomyces sp. NPDC060194 TaxID=3347069 RepID=UPI003667C9E7
MTRGRTALAGAVVVLATAGCTTNGAAPAADAKPAAKSARSAPAVCSDGTYTWFDVDERNVLTAVSPAERIGAGGGGLTRERATVHTPRVAVTFEPGPRVPARRALRSLGARIGLSVDDGADALFTDVRRPPPGGGPRGERVEGVGVPVTLVTYRSVHQVTGGFRYVCADGTTAVGRAVSWTSVGGGLLDCALEPPAGSRGVVAREAARLSCPAGSTAVRPQRS